ncbi:MAG: sulfur transferase domain-containing protein [Pseudomonadota bacterium]|nr:sulfur transferase domain-containing protein [Pseudomonadota bacterium]
MSTSRIKLSGTVAVGRRAPRARDFKRLRRQGFRSVLDLRQDTDPPPRLPLTAAAAEAGKHGIEYIRFPAPFDRTDEALLDGFGAALAGAPKPVFVHCAVGKRSGIYALTHTAIEAGVPGEEMLAMARRLGVLYGPAELQQTFARYVDEHEVQPDPTIRRRQVLHADGRPPPLVSASVRDMATVETPGKFQATSPAPRAEWGRPRPFDRDVAAHGIRRQAGSSDVERRAITGDTSLSLIGAAVVLINRRALPLVLLACGYASQRVLRAWWLDQRNQAPSMLARDAEADAIGDELSALEERVAKLAASA